MTADRPPARVAVADVVRVIACVAAAALAAHLVIRLRQPITWVLIALLLATALSGPVRWLSRWVPRGVAIAGAYVVLALVPVALALLVVPPFVEQGTQLAEDLPGYARDVRDVAERNETLRELDDRYGLIERLEEQAAELPARIGSAAAVLGDLGVQLASSLFALVNIVILSVFMLVGEPRWTRAALASRPPEQRVRLQRLLDRLAAAVSGYVQGALAIALVAGTSTFVVLELLGVPFAAPLAVLAGAASLIPLVGATVAAVVIAAVTVFEGFPTTTLVWAGWALVYQQVENNVIQPQVQRRAVDLDAFVVLVAVLAGATLFGVLGALLAIPLAACARVAAQEWRAWRVEVRAAAADGRA